MGYLSGFRTVPALQLQRTHCAPTPQTQNLRVTVP
jgi:hypothetical protein